jgi:uncharacterized protein
VIQEVIVTTAGPDGVVHIAPMGVHRRGAFIVIAPFRPSRTLDNLLVIRSAVVNYTDDVRIFAGCLTGRRDWPTVPATRVAIPRLADALAHTELELASVEDDPVRPHLICRPLGEFNHRPFQGFNRAAAAVIELAILVSRLDRLPQERITRESESLRIAIEKTAGVRERAAWDWLMERVAAHGAARAT